MTKVGDDLILGMENALAHARGRKKAARETVVAIPETVDVGAIRRKLSLSQSEFAVCFGFSVQSVRNWEQGVRQPEGPARAYLTVIDRKPEAVREALGAHSGDPSRPSLTTG